jgi:tetratricopeptide (TPR) repeat protein
MNRLPETPFSGGPATARVLVDLVREQLAAGDLAAARRSADEALFVLESVSDERAVRAVADASVVLGEAFVLLEDAHRAKARFTCAIEVFDEAHDLPSAARARFGLARAMLALRDPAARPIFEDAGTIFEELGDEPSVLAIDRALREADAELEHCPSSFRKPSTVPPPRLS